MGRLLVSKSSVKSNKALKKIAKDYLKEHKNVKGKYPKAKIGKVVANINDDYVNCTDETIDNKGVSADITSRDDIINFIKDHDVKGLSGSGFPEYKKIETVINSTAAKKYFIVNAVACDPGLVHDAWLLKNHRQEIEKGIEIIKKCVEFDKVIIASPENVPARYPAGEERILCRNLLNIDLAKEDIPADKGILVMNVQTVYSIAQLFKSGMGSRTRFITAADIDSGRAVVLKVKIGESVEQATAKASLSTKGRTLYYGGGVMEAEK